MTHVDLLNGLIDQAITRINHLEQLLVGVATLGFAGWAFLHARPDGGKSGERFDDTRFVFAVVFSGMVASAFCAIYMGRVSVNRSLINLETELQRALLAPDQYTLYNDFFRVTREDAASAVYYVTALFLPVMSLCSLMASLKQITRRRREMRRRRWSGLLTLWGATVGITIVVGWISIWAIDRLLLDAYQYQGVVAALVEQEDRTTSALAGVELISVNDETIELPTDSLNVTRVQRPGPSAPVNSRAPAVSGVEVRNPREGAYKFRVTGLSADAEILFQGVDRKRRVSSTRVHGPGTDRIGIYVLRWRADAAIAVELQGAK